MTYLPINRCCCGLRCCILLCIILITLVLTASSVVMAQAVPHHKIVKFQLRDRYLIIVKVKVNSFGPYDFLLDTGTSRTAIDPWLAHHVRMPVVGAVNLTVASGEHRASLMHLDEIRVGYATSSDADVVVDDIALAKQLAPSLHGILGEDFLSQFDILIDYKRKIVSFGGSAPTGERYYFASGGEFKGAPTSNRILLPVQIVGAVSCNVPLQLDSGAYEPEVFASRLKQIGVQPWSSIAGFGQSSRITHSNVTFKIGTTTIRDLTVVQDRRNAAFDAAGLLPAALFKRIYISHSGGYIILNPSETDEPPMQEIAMDLMGQ